MNNVDRFRRIIVEGFSRGNLDVADELCGPNLIEHEYLVPPNLRGPEILKHQIRSARAEVCDLTLTVEDLVESGDKIWGRSKATGTQPRSGRAVVMDVIDICRFEDGKLVEHWGVPDRFALLHQAGALPAKPA